MRTRNTSPPTPGNSALLRLPDGAPAAVRTRFEAAMVRLPPLKGRPIDLRFLPALHACRGRLRSGTGAGAEVHAASQLRRRVTTLDESLLEDSEELVRILYHEIFHYVWLRLSNRVRRDYETLVAGEQERQARGELGWSADLRRQKLRSEDRQRRTRKWREYVCESFCDTAAWVCSEQRLHVEVTLRARFRARRLEWFRGFPPPGHLLAI